jgi:magnesium chelatase family protein
LERIDLHVEAESVPLSELIGSSQACESSAAIRKRVIAARKIQTERFMDSKGIYCNAQMPDQDIEKYCILEEHARKFLMKQMDVLQLSARSYSRILKVARTIADLQASPAIELNHVAEAIYFRSLDKPLSFPQPGKLKTFKNNIYAINEF